MANDEDGVVKVGDAEERVDGGKDERVREAADALGPLPREVAVAKGDAVRDLDRLPVLVRVEEGVDAERVHEPEDQRRAQHARRRPRRHRKVTHPFSL